MVEDEVRQRPTKIRCGIAGACWLGRSEDHNCMASIKCGRKLQSHFEDVGLSVEILSTMVGVFRKSDLLKYIIAWSLQASDIIR